MIIEIDLPAWAQTCLQQGRTDNLDNVKGIQYEELADGTVK